MTRAPRLSTRKVNTLIKCFAGDIIAHSKKPDIISAASTAGVSGKTANLWYRYLRETIYASLRRAPRFVGPVEMDQKEFGGRGSKRMKQYLKRIKKKLPYAEYMEKARKARAEHKIMVFGVLQRGGDVYVQIIKRSDSRTLTPIVRLVVEQGAEVYTDRWRGFGELGIDGYKHASVDHSVEYKSRAGVHINGIESFWSFAQRRLYKFNGLHASTFPLHIKECQWRYNTKDIASALRALITLDRPKKPVRRRPGRPRLARSSNRKHRPAPRPSRRRSPKGSGPASPAPLAS